MVRSLLLVRRVLLLIHVVVVVGGSRIRRVLTVRGSLTMGHASSWIGCSDLSERSIIDGRVGSPQVWHLCRSSWRMSIGLMRHHRRSCHGSRWLTTPRSRRRRRTLHVAIRVAITILIWWCLAAGVVILVHCTLREVVAADVACVWWGLILRLIVLRGRRRVLIRLRWSLMTWWSGCFLVWWR